MIISAVENVDDDSSLPLLLSSRLFQITSQNELIYIQGVRDGGQ